MKIFRSAILKLSLKLSFMGAIDHVNLNIFTVALFIECQMTHFIVLTVQCFYLRRNKGPSVLLSTRVKRVSITFHENERLNLGNQFEKILDRYIQWQKLRKNLLFWQFCVSFHFPLLTMLRNNEQNLHQAMLSVCNII